MRLGYHLLGTIPMKPSTGGCEPPLSAVAISMLRVQTVVSWGMQDATGNSATAPNSLPITVTGTWSVRQVSGFIPSQAALPGTWVFDTGHNVGPGVGDMIELRFDCVPRHVPLATKADVDALFTFSASFALNYSGSWRPSGSSSGSCCSVV